MEEDGTRAGRPAIRVERLRVVRSGAVVVDDVDCVVRAGSVTGLLGPSGSGKTTLMRAIVGVQRLAAGHVNVFGQPAGAAGLRARVGYMTQAPSVYDDLTVHENLRFFARVLRLGSEDVGHALERVALREASERVVATLSGGERARVSLAAALLGEPPLLVLDEPTVGLDPLLRRDLWALFRRLAAGGAAVLVSSHVMGEAAHCDELVLLRSGRILAQAPPRELLDRTGTDDLDSAFLRLVEGA